MKVVENARGSKYVMCGPHTLACTCARKPANVGARNVPKQHTLVHTLRTLALSDLRGLRTAYMHTHAFLLLHSSHWLLMAEPLSQLVITTLPPRSPLALSCCAVTICGNWLGPKRHVTHTTGDPQILRTHELSQDPEDTLTHTHTRTSLSGYSCDGHVMWWWTEQKAVRAIYCAVGHKQTRWDQTAERYRMEIHTPLTFKIKQCVCSSEVGRRVIFCSFNAQ